MNFLQNHIESLIFCSNEPIKIGDIKQCLNEMFEAEVPEEDILSAIEQLLVKYEQEEFPFQIFKIAGGYQFLTKPAYQTSISILLKQKSKKRLSTSALETIAIIAYKQPISKGQIEQIRGVNCDYAMQKLLEKELIEIKGKSDGIGRPILYGTSQKFLDYFGINDLKDLPSPKDFVNTENVIGEANENDLSELLSGQEGIIASFDNIAETSEQPNTEVQNEIIETPISSSEEIASEEITSTSEINPEEELSTFTEDQDPLSTDENEDNDSFTEDNIDEQN